MKLSEAIIKGCEGTYQVRRKYHDGRDGCCALGAAYRGAGLSLDDIMGACFGGLFHRVLYTYAIHPETGMKGFVQNIVTSLNDTYDWPRLSIAEWIANVVEPEFERGR